MLFVTVRDIRSGVSREGQGARSPRETKPRNIIVRAKNEGMCCDCPKKPLLFADKSVQEEKVKNQT